ncbi:SubName: Full=Uncharacterized protein {ECO:0000313/EMBL:CCA69359.1} [Serendipita indica DSM 11827]|uniref:Uncharacterized protein n=1 Tax=Serendipita indica (strain DSM 11827) TaxID=1109443 RepID=G4TDG0_SERID|nr:SubName: Full=Uncharacterized protein {ECO:0000313/EMBL:CCA69359.1} [Serendipita indica DSM 11827]CCA69359.1 hypothetical protein PIIN_03258 [Serendipita indica DSM 11827]
MAFPDSTISETTLPTTLLTVMDALDINTDGDVDISTTRGPMTAFLDEDIIHYILHHLWNLHSTAWDSEFRPECFRRFFAQYSLINSHWTLPSQRYVYRSALLLWDDQARSFEAGLNGKTRGLQLRSFVRVMDVSISNSKLGVPLLKLDKLLGLTPYLVELRLRIGSEVNTLFVRKNQTQRLRDAFSRLKPTLRALQICIAGEHEKSHVLKEIPTLISIPSLDFISIAIDSGFDIDMPTDLFPEDDWSIHMDQWTTISWPMETCAPTLSMKRVLFAPPAGTTDTPLVAPEVLRLNGEYAYGDINGSPPFIDILKPHLKEILCQPVFMRNDWATFCANLVTLCPNLERLIILHVVSGLWLKKRKQGALARMRILEREDWEIKDADWPQDEKGEVPPEWEFLEELAAQADPKDVIREKILSNGSHIVTFRDEPTKSWKEKNMQEKTHRRPDVLDVRWLAPALAGVEEDREPQEFYDQYEYSWLDPLPRYNQYLIAIRKSQIIIETPV